MGNMKLLWMLTLLTAVELCSSANILGLVLMPSKSHDILVGRLMKELAKRGHDVTYVSPFSEKKNISNYSHIRIQTFKYLEEIAHSVADTVLSDPQIQELKRTDIKKFDLIVTEAFLTEGVFSGFSWVHQAPVVAIATTMPGFWVNYMVGNPAPFSYIPDIFLGYHTKMSFCERFHNAIFGIMADMNHRLYTIPKQDTLMRKHFGKDLPPLNSMVKNVSLVLVNQHYSLSYPRPYLPNMVEVGGMHVGPPKMLPQDLQRYMDEAEDGVILFSLGSNLKSSLMPKEKLKALMNAFSRLKQKVLWKFDLDGLADQPSNVKIFQWLPQSDILAHPNLKILITHGGLLSTTEAVHRGVPVIGIPIFGDQPLNMKEAENAGFGISLDFDRLSSDSIVNAVNEILSNPKYIENVQYRSKLLRDTELTPLEKAVYWVEYVLRHDGARHLRSAAQDLEWYELYCFDVAAILVAISFSVVTLIYYTLMIIRKLLNRCTSRKCGNEKKTN